MHTRISDHHGRSEAEASLPKHPFSAFVPDRPASNPLFRVLNAMGNPSGTSYKLLVLPEFSFAQRTKFFTVCAISFAQRPKIFAVRAKKK